MKIRVQNVNGSRRFTPPNGYESWVEYWEKNSGNKAYFCSVTNCCKNDLVGAHIKKALGSDGSMYIIPLCRACNTRTDVFEVNTTLVPVPSNLQK